jgi:hypothetical protein
MTRIAFERRFPLPRQITCAGLGGGSGARSALKAAVPTVHHGTIQENETLPFQDKQFMIAYLNAVFEYLKSGADRRSAVVELLHVANRWFPIERSTGIPLRQFHTGFLRKTLPRTRLSYWTKPRNLEFISKRQASCRQECPSKWLIAASAWVSSLLTLGSDAARFEPIYIRVSRSYFTIRRCWRA